MTDSSGLNTSVLAIATAAVVSIRSLCETIKSFQNRNNTLRRLYEKLQELDKILDSTILDSLIQVIDGDELMLTLLESPIGRCKRICDELKQPMKKFHGKSKTELLDWTKMEFMGGNINDFIDAIDGYKSTVRIGLGTIGLRNSKTSLEVLQQYDGTIKDTAYNLQVLSQQVGEKLTRCNSQINYAQDASIYLQDEKAVIQQCLRVCKYAGSYIESLSARDSTLLQNVPQNDVENTTWGEFEAQMLTQQTFRASQAPFLGIIDCLGERLQSLVKHKNAGNEKERLRLQEDLDMSKKCLQVCKVASEISYQKTQRIGEAVSEDNSDQVVVTSSADIFDVKIALSKSRSAQLVATVTPENFNYMIDRRYNSRLGELSDHSIPSQTASTTSTTVSSSQRDKQSTFSRAGKDGRTLGSDMRRDKPNSNEVRKRYGDGDGGRQATPSKD